MVNFLTLKKIIVKFLLSFKIVSILIYFYSYSSIKFFIFINTRAYFCSRKFNFFFSVSFWQFIQNAFISFHRNIDFEQHEFDFCMCIGYYRTKVRISSVCVQIKSQNRYSVCTLQCIDYYLKIRICSHITEDRSYSICGTSIINFFIYY